ncbi:hypothetical protein GOBAR_DD13080 [Gossypium barbadense]|nr:hypothetical protein GOBAR_DD13080 [Gossypium barbadense]
MPVLRSRKILPVQPKPRKAQANIDPPATPTQGREQPATRSSPPSLTPSPKTLGSVSGSAPLLRRSLRLSTKASSNAGQDSVLEAEERIERRNGDVSRKRKLSVDNDVSGEDDESGEDEGVLSLRSGKRVTKKGPFGDGNGSGGDVEFEIDRKESALDSKDESLVDGSVSDVELLAQEVNLSDEKPSKKNNRRTSQGRMERFRDTARQNASRFAHFNTQEEDDNILSMEAESEIPSEELEEKGVEDWPGPFSTAMKIIRDRAANLNVRQGSSSSDKVQSLQIKWVPQKCKRKDWSKRLPPSLLDLSLRVLVDNADAIASLAHVPDALRHKLCHMLCDSRRMNSNFFDLLLNGSPTEIRLKDCSWLTEEQFTQCFEKCDTTNLTILQLDFCGHCFADYNLPSTLARSPNSLPALTTLSLTGAYRLSDAGLSALVSSAPALRSVNLSQCSFLTHSAIDILATSLASVLLELFIDDCQSIDAMLVLPSLKKLEHLEVLSVAGLESVTDSFIKEFLIARGDGIKELILMDCWKLTDSSLKIIAETCSNLRALDIGNISKLTDTSFGYLASGCRSLQSLKLCHNAFSDDAIAAFLEMSGEVLKELALNNVGKVGLNTALSLARRSRNLVSLDLSWCRNLTDEAMGLIVDSCLSLRVLKLFGCSQITDVFLYGHSNAKVEIIGLKLSPFLEHIKTPAQGPFQYSSV